MTPGRPVKDFTSLWDRRQLFSQSRTGLMQPNNSVGKWECSTSLVGWPMLPHKLSHQELLLKQREQEVSSWENWLEGRANGQSDCNRRCDTRVSVCSCLLISGCRSGRSFSSSAPSAA